MTNQQTLEFINSNRDKLTLKSLDDAKEGDYVFVHNPGGWSHGWYEVVTVTRTTSTQILCGDKRYSKRDGKPIGGYSSSILIAPLAPEKWNNRQIEIDAIVSRLQEWNDADKRTELTKKIKDAMMNHNSFKTETLLKIWAMIEKDKEEEIGSGCA